MNYLWGLLATLVGGFLYERTKRKSAESLIDNLDSRKDVGEKEAQVAKNEALSSAEEEKRKNIQQETKAKQNEEASLEDLKRFFDSSGK